jgi:competence protein ComEC
MGSLWQTTVSPRWIFWLAVGAVLLGLGTLFLPFGWLWVLFLGLLGAVLADRYPLLPERRFWIGAILLGLLAQGYGALRIPVAGAQDLSRYSDLGIVTLEGKVERASQRSGLTVSVSQLNQPVARPVTGTVQANVQGFLPDLSSGDFVQLKGKLQAVPEGRTDYSAYLRRQGIFSTLRVEHGGLKVLNHAGTGVETWIRPLREKIVAIHREALGPVRGPLLSALVLGDGAAEPLPSVKERYIRVGLAHLLAASGAQVSLILLNVLLLLRNQKPTVQFWVTGLVLFGYLLLTGGSPSVLRAGIMGFFALLGLVSATKIDPLLSLATAALLLLAWDPLLISDLGFSFSFLATLGLLITVPKVTSWLDFLPPVIGMNLAVAVSAYIWTLPLQLASFGSLSPYALLANLLSVPFIEVLTIGGFCSSLMGLIFPLMATWMDWILGWGLSLLDALVQALAQAPGATINIGNLATGQMVLLYGLLALVHLPLSTRALPRWVSIAAVGFILFIPMLRPVPDQLVLFQGTQAGIVRIAGQTWVVDPGTPQTVERYLLPYFQRQGINYLQGVLVLDNQTEQISGLPTLLNQLGTDQVIDLGPQEVTADYSAILVYLLNRGIAYRKLERSLTLAGGLFLAQPSPGLITWSRSLSPNSSETSVLWALGNQLTFPQPETYSLLAFTHPDLNPETLEQLAQNRQPFYWTEVEGDRSFPLHAALSREQQRLLTIVR